MPNPDHYLPISFDDFLGKYDQVLSLFSPEQRAFFDTQDQRSGDPELTKRVLYSIVVGLLRAPGVSYADFQYALHYRLATDARELGFDPDATLAALAGVPWGTLPGLTDYDRETVNSIAVKAFRDAAEGEYRGPNVSTLAADAPSNTRP